MGEGGRRSKASIGKKDVWNLGTERWDRGIGIGNTTIGEAGAHIERVEVLWLRVRRKDGARSSMRREEAQSVLVAGSRRVRAESRVRGEESNITGTRTVDGIM